MSGRTAGSVESRLPYVLAGLVVALLLSAVAAVYAKHLTRKDFVELQALIAERDELETDWSRLQLERSTQASHARVERLARDRLGMRIPDPAEIRLVNP